MDAISPSEIRSPTLAARVFDPLTLLLGAAIFELALNRLWTGHAPPSLHLFAATFVGTLAAAVLGAGTIRIVRRRDLLPLGARGLVALFGAVFAPLCVAALALPIGRLQLHAQTAFVFFCLALALALFARPVPWRARAGFGLVLLPLIVRGWAEIADVVPSLALPFVGFTERLESVGQFAVLSGGLFAPALFLSGAPERARARGRALVLAFVVASWFGILYAIDNPMAGIAARSLGLRPPTSATMAVTFVAAVFGYVLTATAMLLERGAHRLVGGGFAMVGLAGFALGHPYQILLSACGVLFAASGLAGADELI